MKYLIDTNALSELARDEPNTQVSAWFSVHSGDELLISAITVGELAYGIENMPDGRKKDELAVWFKSTLLEWFAGAVVPLGEEVMFVWARLRATTRTLPVLDSLIAASALSARATLVTRNTKDFTGIANLTVVNPWHS